MVPSLLGDSVTSGVTGALVPGPHPGLGTGSPAAPWGWWHPAHRCGTASPVWHCLGTGSPAPGPQCVSGTGSPVPYPAQCHGTESSGTVSPTWCHDTVSPAQYHDSIPVSPARGCSILAHHHNNVPSWCLQGSLGTVSPAWCHGTGSLADLGVPFTGWAQCPQPSDMPQGPQAVSPAQYHVTGSLGAVSPA